MSAPHYTFRLNFETVRDLTMEEAIDLARHDCLKPGAEVLLYVRIDKYWYLLGEYYHMSSKSQQPYVDKDNHFVRQCYAAPCLAGYPYVNERIKSTL